MTTDSGAQAVWTREHLRGALDVVLHGGLYARNQAAEDILSEHERLAAQVAALTAERDGLREVAEAARKLVALCIAIEARQPLTGMVTSEELAEAVKQEDAETALLFAADTRLRNAVAASAATTPSAGAQEGNDATRND